MTSISRRAALGLALSLGLAALAGWSCGETGDTDPTPVATFKITPAANSTPGTSSSPAATAVPTTDEPPAPPGSPGTSTVLEVAGVSNEFDVEELTAPAGAITVEFDNRDSGVVHNIHFYRGSDDEGESVAETELESGPIEQTLTFEVESGEYYYVCDAHPTTMEGILTVE